MKCVKKFKFTCGIFGDSIGDKFRILDKFFKSKNNFRSFIIFIVQQNQKTLEKLSKKRTERKDI